MNCGQPIHVYGHKREATHVCELNYANGDVRRVYLCSGCAPVFVGNVRRYSSLEPKVRELTEEERSLV